MRYFFTLVLIIICVQFVNAEVLKESGQAYFDYGVFAFEEENYQEAEKNLKFALEFNQENPDYHYYLAKVYLETERYDEAEKHFKEAEKIEPEMPGLKFDMAMLEYKKEDFLKASDIFKSVADSSPNNASSQYYTGMSLAKAEKCEQAEEYFIRAREITPSAALHGDYALGICYQITGQHKLAVEKFKKVKEAPDSGDLGVSADNWLKDPENAAKGPKSYSIYLIASRIYDDNVGLQPENQEIFSEEDDWASEAYVFGSYNLINKKHLKAGAGVDFHHTRYDELSDFDQTGTVLSLYTKYGLKPFTLGLSYYLLYHWLDSESAMRIHRITPNVSWRVSKDITSLLSYSYYKESDFLDKGRDGDINSIFMSLSYKLPWHKSRISAGMGYEKKDASADDESFGRLNTQLALFLNLPWEMELGIMGKFADKKYDNEDLWAGVTRNDDKYSGIISLSRKVYFDWLNFMTEYSHTKNDSNIISHNYEKNQIKLSLSASF